MRIHRRHPWDLSPQEAVALQRELRNEIRLEPPIDIGSVRLIAGVDVSVKDDQSHAAVVVATFPDMRLVETVTARRPTPFPYIPGLLTFREGPVLEEAFERLENEPDVFLFDGMGIAHPRRIGIAAHMGLWLQKPTVGCGKTRLCGRFDLLPEEKGAMAPLVDDGEEIGMAVRTRTRMNPMFISPGHLADIPSSVELVMRCTEKYRLPEPIRMAHKAAGDFDPAVG